MKNLELISSKTLDESSLPMFAINNEHKVIFWNKACEYLTGLPASKVIGTTDHWKAFYLTERPCLVDFIVDGINEKAIEFYKPNLIVDDKNHLKYEGWITTPDKNLRYFSVEASILFDSENKRMGAIAILFDLTSHKNINEKLKMSYDVFDDISDGVLITNENNHIIFVNRAVEDMSGFSKKELLGNTPAIFSMREQDRSFVKQLWKSLNEKGHWRGEFMNLTKDRKPYHVRYNITKFISDLGEVNHIAFLANITEQKTMMEQLRIRANYDSLTKLPNRAMLEQNINTLITQAKNNNSSFAVIFLDLDKFKNVNDSCGHDVGDALLKEIATRLKTAIRPGDMVARLSGDEFVIVLNPIYDEYEVDLVVKKINQAFLSSFEIESHMLSISASMGVAIYPQAGITLDDLLKNADSSMYWSKARSNGDTSQYNIKMNEIFIENMAIVEKLKSDAYNHMQIYLQPQYSLVTNKIYGAEALIRWNDPTLGWISPERFVPLAEDFGLVDKIWDFMLDNSCRIIKESGVKIAVNLSGSQLMQPNLVKDVDKYLKKYCINPALLSFEVTETVLISNFNVAKEILEKFNTMGISLALDDFGTGYSSLGYLNQLPFDYIKIDKSFIQDPNNKSIATLIIEMAKKLNLSTIAEGIENIEQVLRFKSAGCSIIQGYFYSKPLIETDFLSFIRENKSVEISEAIKIELLEKTLEVEGGVSNRFNEIISQLERLESAEFNPEVSIHMEEIIGLYNNLMIYFFEKEELMLEKKFVDYEKCRQENEEFLNTLLEKISEVNEKHKDPKALFGFVRRWLIANSLISANKLFNNEKIIS